MNSRTLSKYFSQRPITFGLRGDPHLWDELEAKTKSYTIPKTKEELAEQLHKLFKELTGEELERGRNIFFERFSKGGMSSGYVSSDFWIDIGFPLIVERFIKNDLQY